MSMDGFLVAMVSANKDSLPFLVHQVEAEDM
jgi:hypothetical protein